MDLLDQMTTFVQVVDRGSLSAASRALRLSLPAVSRQLRSLEQELGASLIARSTRRLRVTEAGDRWYAHCVRVLHEVDAAKASVRAGRDVRGRLVVSASLSYGATLVVPRLPGLVAAHPHLTIDLRLEDHLIDLVGEGVDVAIRAGSSPPDSTAFVAQPISTMRRILVASPRFLRKHAAPRTPSALARVPCLVQVTPAGQVIRWSLERGDDEQTIDVSGPLRSTTPLALRELAVADAGIAYLPAWLVAAELAAGRLRRVLPEWHSREHTAWGVYRAERRGDPRIRALFAAL